MIIPAIDLMNGQCIRLTKGRPEEKKLYFKDPLEPLRRFESLGVEWIHLVDLDAAMEIGDNTRVIRTILENATVKFEVAGGIRTVEKAKKLLSSGASRVVLGTAVADHPERLEYWVSELGGEKIGIALDFSGGKLMVEGWRSETRTNYLELLKAIHNLEVAVIILTSIERDGTLGGPDVKMIEKFKRMVNVPLIAAGGISSITDLERLSKVKVEGVIIGKAFYEGKIDLETAIKRFKT